MKTKKISLYYGVTSREVIPPGPGEIERKDYWIKQVQSTVEADWKPKTVKVTYELYDPEVDQMRKFLNGPVVDWWIIQSQDILNGDVSPELHKIGRETLFDKTLGYDVEIIGGTTRKRGSTGDFTDVQKMHDFLEMLRETEFEPNGYEFPKSEDFWKLADAYGYDKAKKVSIELLQRRIRGKMGYPQDVGWHIM